MNKRECELFDSLIVFRPEAEVQRFAGIEFGALEGLSFQFCPGRIQAALNRLAVGIVQWGEGCLKIRAFAATSPQFSIETTFLVSSGFGFGGREGSNSPGNSSFGLNDTGVEVIFVGKSRVN